MGRPALYQSDPSRLERALSVLRGGGTRSAAATAAGVGRETLERWIDNDPDLRRTIESAEQSATSAGVRPAAVAAPRIGPAKSETADRWASVRAAASALGPGLYGCLLWLEGKIGAHNEHAPAWDHMPLMPPALLAIFRDFWASGKQELLIRAGRGFGKSTMLTRPTIIECLFAPRVVNGGEIAIWPELSVDMDEANLKLSVLEKLLQIAGFRRDDPAEEWSFKTLKQERGRSRIQFQNSVHERIEIRVYPATVKALSGPTLKGARHDEEAKWKTSSKDETNSAEEVIDAEAGAFRGRPHAHLYRDSSAWKTEGAHYNDIEAGDTPTRHVARIGDDFLELARGGFEARAEMSNAADAAEIRAYAAALTADSPNLPSWFNPSLDPRTLKARNVCVFLREYGSQSSGDDGDGDFFDELLLDAAEARERPAGPPEACFAAIDTGAKKNPAALAIVGRWETKEGPRFAPVFFRAWKPTRGAPLDLRLLVLPEMARHTLHFECALWWSDGFASDQVDLVASGKGITVVYVATSEAFRDIYSPVSDGLARGEISLSGCEGATEAAAQLRRVSSEIDTGPTGARVRILVPEDAGGEHGDLGVALVRALAAAGAGRMATEDDGEAIGEPSRYAAEFSRRRSR